MDALSRIDHVAVLVPSLEHAVQPFREAGLPVGTFESFSAEGTLECYVGDANSASRLLLIEPMTDGVYRAAINKRGAGLHHIAMEFPNLQSLLSEIESTGWLLQPRSLTTVGSAQVAWLCRPGVPFLIEAMLQDRGGIKRPPFLERVEVAFSEEYLNLVGSLLSGFCLRKSQGEARLWFRGQALPISRLTVGSPF